MTKAKCMIAIDRRLVEEYIEELLSEAKKLVEEFERIKSKLRSHYDPIRSVDLLIPYTEFNSDYRSWHDYFLNWDKKAMRALRQMFTTKEFSEDFQVNIPALLVRNDPISDFNQDQRRLVRKKQILESIRDSLLLYDPQAISKVLDKTANEKRTTDNVNPGRVFVVHGHDNEMKLNVARFLDHLALEPLILHEQANKGRTIIEKFEHHVAECSYAIILMSPDDEGAEAPVKLLDQLKPRARQNVVFELGFFFGKLDRGRVCILHRGGIERPTDVDGIVYVPYEEKDWKQKLARELREAGYKFDANKLLDC